MKRIVLILVIGLFVFKKSKANQDFIISKQNANLLFENLNPLDPNSLQLFKLTQELIKEQFHDSIYIAVFFSIDSFYYSSNILPIKPKYCLGYGNHVFQNYKGDQPINSFSRHKAILLYCNGTRINIEECIKLIFYGLKQHNEIEKRQKLLLAKTIIPFVGLGKPYGSNVFGNELAISPHYNFIYSIPEPVVKQILATHPTQIESYIHRKAFRRWTPQPPASFGKIDYYIQDNKYVIYRVLGKNDKWQAENKTTWQEQLNDTAGTPLFSLDHLDDIIADGQNNYIITVGDSFYHYKLNEKEFLGPYYFPQLELPHWAPTTYQNKLEVSGDTLTMRAFNYTLNNEHYDIIYNTKTKFVYIDSNSIGPYIKNIIDHLKHDAYVDDSMHQYKVSLKRKAIQKDKNRPQALVLAIIVLSLNAFLIWRSRK